MSVFINIIRTFIELEVHQEMLNNQKIEEYVSNGYLIVNDIITRNELELLKEEIIQIAKGKYPGKGFNIFSNQLTDNEILRQILAVHQPHYLSPILVDFIKKKILLTSYQKSRVPIYHSGKGM